MIVKEDLINQLKHYFALNLYEVKIWTAILSRGVSTAGELSDIADVPRSRSYDILDSLEKKGFVIQKLGKPIKYLAVPPSEVIERVKKNMREDAKRKVDNLDKLRSTTIMTDLTEMHTQGIETIKPSDLSGSIQGKNNVIDHLETSMKAAENSITMVTSADDLVKHSETLKTVFKGLKKKGVKIRIAAPITKDNKDIAEELKEYAEIRNHDANSRFVVVDGKHLTFMVMDHQKVHPSYDLGIWVNTPVFATTLENMFNLAWKDMKKQ